MNLQRFEPDWLTWRRLGLALAVVFAAMLGVAAVRIADWHYVQNAGTPAVDTSEGANATEMVVDSGDRLLTTNFRAETTVTLVNATVVNASNPSASGVPETASVLPENRTTVRYVRGVDYDDRALLLTYEEYAPVRQNETVVRVPYRQGGLVWLMQATALGDGAGRGTMYLGDGRAVVGFEMENGTFYRQSSTMGEFDDDDDMRRYAQAFHDPRQPWRVVDRRNGTVVLRLDDVDDYYDAARIPPLPHVRAVHDGSSITAYVDADTGYLTKVVEHRIVTVRLEERRDDRPNQVFTQRVHYRAVTTYEYGVDVGPPADAPGRPPRAWLYDLIQY